MKDKILEMQSIYKTFPGVVALKDVDFDLEIGEVHALIGENGAGKSTLMKILSGFHPKDSGEIIINGIKKEISNPSDSLSLGISTIYQDIIAVPYISVAENIKLNNRPRNKIGIINWRKLYKEVNQLLTELSIKIDVKENISNLSMAQQELASIAKALSTNAKIIIMDEPTASLTEEEKNLLFDIIKNLKAKNISIIYISHRMEEIFEIADRVTVLRDGVKIITKPVQDTTKDEIIRYMIGRNIDDMYEKTIIESEASIILEVKNFNKKNYFKDINFKLCKGEILGFAGLVGAGRSEIMKALYGLINKDSGEVILEGKKVIINSPKKAISLGLGLMPEDRKIEGLILDLPVDQNISLATIKKISRFGFLVKSLEDKLAKNFIEKLSIKCHSLSQKVMNLSGGNQQKVIISRLLALNPKILILDEPTKGIDVGSKAEIHKLIVEIVKEGTSVILVSSEMTEVLKLSNRIIIMREGQIVNSMNISDANEEIVLRYMTGIH